MSANLRQSADATRPEYAPTGGVKTQMRVSDLREFIARGRGEALGTETFAVWPMDKWSVWRRTTGSEWAVCVADGLESLVACRAWGGK